MEGNKARGKIKRRKAWGKNQHGKSVLLGDKYACNVWRQTSMTNGGKIEGQTCLKILEGKNKTEKY